MTASNRAGGTAGTRNRGRSAVFPDSLRSAATAWLVMPVATRRSTCGSFRQVVCLSWLPPQRRDSGEIALRPEPGEQLPCRLQQSGFDHRPDTLAKKRTGSRLTRALLVLCQYDLRKGTDG